MKTKLSNKFGISVFFILIALIVGTAIIVGGYLYYSYEEKNIRKEKYNELKAIAELKINQIEQWQKERIGDAIVISQNSFFKIAIEKYKANRVNSRLKRDILNQLSLLKTQFGYNDILIADTNENLFCSLDTSIDTLSLVTRKYIKRAFAKHEVIFTDFYYCNLHNQIHFDFIAPITGVDEKPIAALILRINPANFLFPLMQSWPLPSKSAETLIVRRDGDSVTYVNELRHISNSALKLKIPITRIEVPSVQAVLGNIGIWEGVDYRGVNVISDIRPITSTTWFMVSKVDKSEIFSELYYRSAVIISFVSLLIFLLVSLLAWVYRARQKNIYKKLFLAEKKLGESEEIFRAIFNNNSAAIAVIEPDTSISMVNEEYCQMSGYTKQEVIGMSWTKQIPPEDLPRLKEYNRLRLLNPKDAPEKYEFTFFHKNGKIKNALMSVAMIPDNKKIIASFVDITIRKQTEEAIQKSEEQYRILVEQASDGIFLSDANGKYLEVNSAGCRILGYTREEILQKTLHDLTHNTVESPIRLDELRAGKTLLSEREMIRKDGSIVPVEISAKQLSGGRFQGIVRDITERKLRENKLRESEERFRSLFEHMLNGFAYCQMLYDNGQPVDFIYLNVNTTFESLTGLKDVIGKKVSEVIPGFQESDKNLLEIYGRVAMTGMPDNFEMFVQSLDDWYSITVYSPKKDFFVAVFDVITERKKAEEALRESNEYLENLFRYANAPIIVWDTQFKITRFNPAFEMLTGRKLGDVIGKPIEILFPSELVENSMNLIRKANEGERWETVEINILHINGYIRTVLWNSAFMLGQDGKTIIATVAQGQDITERKQAEEALQQSERLYRAIGESIDYGVWVCAPDGRNLYASESFLKMVGITQEQCSNFGWGDVLHPDDAERTIAAWQECVRTGGNWDIEHRFRGIDGQWHNVLARGIAVRNEQGEITSWAGINLDITERKKAEEELKVSEKKLREAQELSHLGFWNWNVKTGDVEWSEEVFKIFCLNPKEFTPHIDSILAFSPWPEDHQRDKELINRAITNHEPGSYEQKFLRPDKSIGYYYSTFQGNYDENSDLISIVGTVLDITERKQAEEALQLKNIVFDFSIAANSVADSNGNITEANNAFIQTWGYQSKDEVIGNPILHFIKNKNEAIAIIASINEYGKWEGEYTALRKDGSTFIAYGLATDLKDSSGNLIGYQSAAIDITGRKLAEEELKTSESFLNNIINLSPYPMWISDETGTLIRINKSCLDLLQISQNEVLGKYNILQDNIVEEQGFMPLVKSLFKTGKTANFVLRYDSSQLKHLQLQHFKFLILSVTIFPIRDAKGKISNAVIQHIDITEQKRVEEEILKLNETLEQRVNERTVELKESEERFRQLAEASYEAIIIHDKGVLLMANDQYYNLFGFKPEEMLGKQVMPLTIAPDSLKVLNDQIAAGGTGPYTATGLRKDGKTFPIEIRARNMEYKGHNVRVAAILDITLRVKVEKELRERTAALEIANKELEAFSYSVSHDLRAPLRHISGFVELLSNRFKDVLTKKGKHYVDEIADSVNQMGLLIDDLLQFSRMSRVELGETVLEMNRIVEEVAMQLQQDYPKYYIKWVIGKLPNPLGDEAMIRLVWINLLSNAIKFSRTRKKSIIEIGVKEESTETIFFVRDNGVGFDMQYAHKLFGVFQRLHPTEEFEGTGIGLANVQRIISRHGGRTWAEAKLNKGATFYFSLPKKS